MAGVGVVFKQEPGCTSEDEATPTSKIGHNVPSESPVSLVDLEERILQLCAESPRGITDEVIMKDQPLLDTGIRLKALQRLLSQGKIDLLKKDSTLVYKLKTTTSTPSKTKGFEREERLVYQVIEDSSNKGIWTRDIRNKTNLGPVHVTKILKTLESKKLIKLVKSVQASKKKVYMLYDLTPDVSLTGGAWYSDQEFESEFVEVLNHHCLRFLERKASKAHATHFDPLSLSSASLCSTQEVCKFITELGISKVKLSVDNIRIILDTLVYDGSAEVEVTAVMGDGRDDEAEDEGTLRLYRVARQLIRDTGFNRIPCGICQVIDQCCDGGAISPQTCVYLKNWLDF